MVREFVTRFPQWTQNPVERIVGPLQEFIHNSAAGGIVLLSAAVLALVLANSPLSEAYNAVLHSEVAIRAGSYELRADMLHWVNDGLMAIFFFLVGLEMKRELLVGELSNRRAAVLPLIAAVGGATVPAMIYLLGMPTQVVPGTAQVQVVFVAASVTILQAVQHQTVDALLAMVLLLGGVVGSHFGSVLSGRLRGEQLRGLLAVLLLLVAVKLLVDLTLPPDDANSVVTPRSR